ncbi:MAG: hypothetical protein ACHQCI_03120 [Solirubrobacterales bacterium]
MKLRSALLPPSHSTELDTGLRFTDILFGLVIAQIFLRLQNVAELQGFVRWQLITSAIIVLGSWIGFRRSVNRSQYEVQFFNLPLFRFVLDQLMVLLYFRIAILTPTDPSAPVDPSTLTGSTLKALLLVFVLYVLWDVGGLLMAHGWRGQSSKYENARADWPSLLITLFFLAAFGALYHVCTEIDVGEHQASLLFGGASLLLLLYRWAKEIHATRRAERDGKLEDTGALTGRKYKDP